MKRSLIQFLMVILAICICSAAMTACQNNEPTLYTVTYVAGGASGSAPAAEQHESGETFKLKGSDVFTRDGYSFSGWNDGEKTYEAGADYEMPDKDVVFTAQWNEVKAASLDGNWSGADLDGKELFDVDVTLNVEAAIKEADGGAYIVLKLTGSTESNGAPLSVSMASALFMSGSDGDFAAEGGSLEYRNDIVKLTLDFGSGNDVEMTFDTRNDLDASPEIGGTYVANAENGDVYTIDFDASTLKIKRGAGEDEQSAPNASSDENFDDRIVLYGNDTIETMPRPQEIDGGEMPAPDLSDGEGETNIESLDVDKVVEVGRYIVVFTNEHSDGNEAGNGNSGMSSGETDMDESGSEAGSNSDIGLGDDYEESYYEGDMSGGYEIGGMSGILNDDMSGEESDNGSVGGTGGSTDGNGSVGGTSGSTDGNGSVGGTGGSTDGNGSVGGTGDNASIGGTETGSEQKGSTAFLVLYEGENGVLIANTGEGELLEFRAETAGING